MGRGGGGENLGMQFHHNSSQTGELELSASSEAQVLGFEVLGQVAS